MGNEKVMPVTALLERLRKIKLSPTIKKNSNFSSGKTIKTALKVTVCKRKRKQIKTHLKQLENMHTSYKVRRGGNKKKVKFTSTPLLIQSIKERTSRY